MLSLTQPQAEQRWAAITPQLREALFSDVNADFVWNLCQSEHLSEEKSYQVAESAGYVLLGFLHPEDLSGELVKSLELPSPLAKTISDSINSRVFTPLRADIDSVYSPISKLEVTPSSTVLRDVSIAPKATPVISATAPAQSPIKPIPIPPPSGPTLSLNRLVTVSDVGWARQPAAMPKASPVSPVATTPTAPATPVPAPTPPQEPAPMMLHEDTTFKPAEKNANFTLSRPGIVGEMSLNRANTVPQPPQRPAVLEFGSKPTVPVPPKPPTPGAQAKPYSEFRPSLASTPTANSGPRNVNQIVPPAPSATPAPSAAMPIPPPPQIPRTPQVWHIPSAPTPTQSATAATLMPKPPTPTSPPPTSPQPPAPGTPPAPIQKDFL